MTAVVSAPQALPAECARLRIKSRHEALGSRLDVAGERRADVAWQHQRAARGAMFQHLAAAYPRLLSIGVLGEIPVRVIDLQQMVKHVADEHGLRTAALELEHDMAGGVAGCRQDFEKLVEPMRAGDKVG